jgi:hypothetical protein
MSTTPATTDTEKSEKRKLALWERLNRLFKIPPKTQDAKDGSGRKVIIEHRVGRSNVAYTVPMLMDRLGLEDEWADTCVKLEKKFRDREMFDKLSDQVYRGQRAKLSGAVKAFRAHLAKFYQTQGIAPLLAFVPVNDKDMGLYIQAFVDAITHQLVVGDVGDAVLWSETVAIRTKPLADLYRESQSTAKRLLGRKDVNKDLAARLEAVVAGNPPKLGFRSADAE